ncbi:protein rolling stone isoform X2 [Heptranchias perlo]|uniref:protein rolling stone isoform X2 n=1 Tax=Heptranchias perlo TaxID=212740 RepID=UPI003559C786
MGTSWIKHLRQEFTPEKISLKARIPQLILQSQWRLHPVVWLFYRIFMAAYSLTWCVCGGVQTNNLKWFIFLTHITYIILTIYFNLALVNLICYMTLGQKKPTRNIKAVSLEEMSSSSPVPEIEQRTPSLKFQTEFYAPPSALYPTICIQWALHNLTCVITLCVTITYWIFTYIPGQSRLDSININMHVMNSVLVLLELSMTAAPIHLAHFVYVMAYCLTYIIFTIVYWAAGGTNLKGEAFIYRILSYGENPGLAAGCVIVTICFITPALQLLVWNLHFLRRHIYLKLNWKDGKVPHC